jgi:hypothetical protein
LNLAVSTASRAADKADDQGQIQNAQAIREPFILYRSGRPFVERGPEPESFE